MYLLSITRGVVLIRKTSGQLKLIFHDTFIKHQKKKMSMKTNFKFLTLIESSCFEKKKLVLNLIAYVFSKPIRRMYFGR